MSRFYKGCFLSRGVLIHVKVRQKNRLLFKMTFFAFRLLLIIFVLSLQII